MTPRSLSDRLLPVSHSLRFLLVALAGWINQQQREVIDYLRAENRVRAVSNDIPHFSARVAVLPRRDRRTAADSSAMLSGSDPRADDQSHGHGPSSATLRPPIAPARPTHREPHDRHSSRRSSVNGAGVAPNRADRGGQSGRDESDRAGTPTRSLQTPTMRPETRGATPARSGPAACLRLHVGERAPARWS